MSGGGWIGVDLDGTLAHYDGWKGEFHIGAPIPAMVERIRGWRAMGLEVRIFTARVAEAEDNRARAPVDMIRAAIAEWCLTHVGEILTVTNVKDFGMVQLWDDRAVHCVPNTGNACCQAHAGVDAVGILRAALVRMVGAETREDLVRMKAMLASVDEPEAKDGVFAIDALLALTP